MSYVPATANPDMWVVIGGMVAGAFAVVWRSRSGNGHAAPAATGGDSPRLHGSEAEFDALLETHGVDDSWGEQADG
jgi:hypothetical protein